MSDWNTEFVCPPILFTIYNRPALTKRVFDQIRIVKPNKLFIAADGPKNNKVNDKDLCLETREVVKKIDWDCDVFTLFREKNQGCKIAISSAINWFFQQVEEGIILEDDCLPELTFFPFCKELLNKYKTDTRIGIISGDSFVKDKNCEYSYYFSNFPHVWGWATWKRTWEQYDCSMRDWLKFRDLDWLVEKTGSKYYAKIWFNIFDKVYKQQIDTWDYQVVFMLWTQSQMSIVPNFNLVSNIGFGFDSTHTKNVSDKFSIMSTESMAFPLTHPRLISRDIKRDFMESKSIFGSPMLKPIKVIKKIRKILQIDESS